MEKSKIDKEWQYGLSGTNDTKPSKFCSLPSTVGRKEAAVI